MQKRVFDKIQHPFIIETLRKLEIERNFLKMIKGMYEKPTANITHNGERSFQSFPLRWGTREGGLLSLLVLNIVLKSSSQST